MTAAITIDGLTVEYDGVVALRDVSVSVSAGSMLAVVGPNGSGKSTLLKAVMQVVRPSSGSVRVFGEPVATSRGRLTYVPQRSSVDWDFPITVREVVMQGRFGKMGWFRRPSNADREAVDGAIARLDIGSLVGRQVGELSGGQQQRVFLARALAQEGEVLLLDEPFAGVDAVSEAAMLDVLRELHAAGRTIVVVHHDLSTVAAVFDEVLLLNNRVVAAGPVASVLTVERLTEAYGGSVAVFGGQAAVVQS